MPCILYAGRSSGSSAPSSMVKKNAAKRKRCRADGLVFDACRAHVLKPDSLKYRESLAGPCLPALLQENTAMLLAVRAATGEVPLVQKTAQEGFMRLATVNEEMPYWHLGAKAAKWSERSAKKLRAMLRDVSQSLHKEKSRYKSCTKPWLQPFWDAAHEATPRATRAHVQRVFMHVARCLHMYLHNHRRIK